MSAMDGDCSETEPSLWTQYKNELHKIWSDTVFRRKLGATFMVYGAYFAFEWLFAVVGPCVPVLQLIYRQDLQTIAWVLTVFSVGYFSGCSLHGPLRKVVSNTGLLVTYAILHGGCSIITPRCSWFWLLVVVRFGAGVALGGTDTAAHDELFTIWGCKAKPFCQLLLVVSGLGGSLSSMAVKNILEPSRNVVYSPNLTLIREGFEQETAGYTEPPSILQPLTPELEKQVNFAFALAGIVSFLSAVPFIIEQILVMVGLWDHPYEQMTQSDRFKETPRTFTGRGSITVVALLLIVNLLFTGTIDSIALYIASFANGVFQQDVGVGALMTSVFFMAGIVGGLLFIVLSLVLSTRTILFVCLFGSAISFMFLTISAVMVFHQGVWISVVACGMLLSPGWPALFTFIEENIAPFTGTLASAFMTAGALGMVINPIMFGYAMGTGSAVYFTYLALGEWVVVVILFLIVVCLHGNQKLYTALPNTQRSCEELSLVE